MVGSTRHSHFHNQSTTQHVYYSGAIGMHKYVTDENEEEEEEEEEGKIAKVTLDTWYDLASVTKVLATTSAMSILYELGYVDLRQSVQTYLCSEEEMEFTEGKSYIAFGVNGKQNVTVLNLLLHNSGLSPDPMPYWSVVVGCFLCIFSV